MEDIRKPHIFFGEGYCMQSSQVNIHGDNYGRCLVPVNWHGDDIS
jgi:hypothetical protein